MFCFLFKNKFMRALEVEHRYADLIGDLAQADGYLGNERGGLKEKLRMHTL